MNLEILADVELRHAHIIVKFYRNGAVVDNKDTHRISEPVFRASSCFLHDLRNLMCVISHQSELGYRAHNLDEAALRKILSRIHVTARMTIDLIESEGPVYFGPDCLDIRVVIERVAEVARGRGGPGVEVHCILPEHPVWIEDEPEALMRLCLNLALNAVDASPEGEVILSLSSHADAPEMDDLVAGNVPPRPWVMLEIIDDGPGIPVEFKDRIWERGFTTKQRNGSGEGLALVRRLTEAAGAGITLGCDSAGRTCFRVYWPAR